MVIRPLFIFFSENHSFRGAKGEKGNPGINGIPGAPGQKGESGIVKGQKPSTGAIGHCNTVNGGHGREIHCSYNGGYQYVVGFCSSGRNLDCVNKSKSHEYTCCNTHKISGHNQCYQKFGSYG